MRGEHFLKREPIQNRRKVKGNILKNCHQQEFWVNKVFFDNNKSYLKTKIRILSFLGALSSFRKNGQTPTRQSDKDSAKG